MRRSPVSASNCASPSVNRMSSANVSRASRAPMDTDRGHRADHDLAGVTEQFGAGDDAHLGAADLDPPPPAALRTGAPPPGSRPRCRTGRSRQTPATSLLGRGRCIVPLKFLVAPVVGRRGCEVGPVGASATACRPSSGSPAALAAGTAFTSSSVDTTAPPTDSGDPPPSGTGRRVRIDTGVGRITVPVTEVEVSECRVEPQCRHGDELLVALGPLCTGTGPSSVPRPRVRYTELPSPARVGRERKPLCGGLQTRPQHALVHLAGDDRAVVRALENPPGRRTAASPGDTKP